MGLKYGLLAALTLVLASALVWDRLHPPVPRDAAGGAPDPGDTVRVIVGGDPIPDPPREPAPGPGPAAFPSVPPGAGDPAAPAPAPAPPGAAAEPSPERTWTVAPGDTLGEIAQKALGTSRRAGELARHNGIGLDAILRVGQVLRVPGGGPGGPSPAEAAGPAAAPPPPARPSAPEAPRARTHRVRSGDTLYSLSRRYYGDGGSWRRIAEANGIAEAEGLRVGAEIRIP